MSPDILHVIGRRTVVRFLLGLSFLAPPLGAGAEETRLLPLGFIQLWSSYQRDGALPARWDLQAQRVRAGGAGRVHPKLGYFFLAELGNGNPTGSGRATLLDAHATWTLHPFLNLRFGQDWYKFSQEGTWTVFEMPFILRSEIVDAIWLKMGRNGSFGYDRGVFAYGKGRLGLPLAYAVSSTAGTGLNLPEDNGHRDWVARTVLTPVRGWNVGASGFRGHSRLPSAVSAGETVDLPERAFGVETAYSSKGRWRFIGEYLAGRQEEGPSGSPALARPRGFYAAAGISPLRRWELWVRRAYFDPDQSSARDIARTWTFGATYVISGFTNFKVNYHARTAEDGFSAVTGGRRPRDLVLAQLQVFFFPKEWEPNFLAPLGDENP